MPFIPRIVIDEDGHTHFLEVGNEMVLFDGVPASIEQLDQNAFRFKTRTVEATIEASALGSAFAGTDPTLAAVGSLFGAYLGLVAQQQYLAHSLQRVNNEITSLCGRLTSGGPLIFPQPHFDPITERVLRHFDGTEKMTTVIASILGHPASLVRAWVAHIQPLPDLSVAEESGEEQAINGEDTSFSVEAEQQALPGENDAVSPPNQEEASDGSHSSSDVEEPATGKLSTLHLPRTWNSERLMQLEQALLMCDASTLKEAMEQVAPSFECTLGAIQGQVYANGMNIRFKEKQKARVSSTIEKQTVSASDEQNEETTLCLESSEEGSAPGTETDGLTQSPTLVSEAFTWDDGKIQQLRTAFLESQATSTSDAIQEIAAQFDWPLISVRSKIYYLRLPESKKQQQPVTSPLVVATQDLQENELKYGNYRWRIVIGTKIDQWNLQYRYGEFPEQFRGQEVVFNNQRYRVDKFYNQDVYLSLLVQQATTSAEISSPTEFAVPA